MEDGTEQRKNKQSWDERKKEDLNKRTDLRAGKKGYV